ncbi:unnamed protein product [Cylicocyclus nassatus]|uniref:Uncharacterized protein n=1 Tax=Cylicocyclus nassatus TaxID=53992 RepID=A0AA36DJE8_CYLNA|nr:unnamed protein product [Cylicocyclus nassatus]
MHASTSQQTSVGPDHTRHGGEVCPVYPRPGHGSSGEQIPLLVNWYRLECGLSGKTIYIYDIQIFEISHSRGRQRRVPVRGRDELRTLFWSCLRSNPSIFGSYTGTIFDDFSKAFTINRWRLRNDRGNVQFYKSERGSEKECSMSIKPLTDLTFDLSSKDDQQRNNSALVTKNLFTQRARYAPEMGDSGWSFVNQWDVCYGSIYRVPRQGDDLETSVKVATGVRAWLGIYNSVKMLEDCTPALAFGLVNRLYYEIEMDLLTFYLDFLEELGLSHERERNPQFLRDMGMNTHQRKRMTNRLCGLRVMTRKFLSWDRYSNSHVYI